MSVVLFVALVTGEAGLGYNAIFPDLPNVTASGRDLSDLLVASREALSEDFCVLSGAPLRFRRRAGVRK